MKNEENKLQEIKAKIDSLDETDEGFLRGGFTMIGIGESPNQVNDGCSNNQCTNHECNTSCPNTGCESNTGCTNDACNGNCKVTKATSGISPSIGLTFNL